MSISEHRSTASAYRMVVNYDAVFLLHVVQCFVAAMTIKILILICRLHIHDVYLLLYHIPEGLWVLHKVYAMVLLLERFRVHCEFNIFINKEQYNVFSFFWFFILQLNLKCFEPFEGTESSSSQSSYAFSGINELNLYYRTQVIQYGSSHSTGKALSSFHISF